MAKRMINKKQSGKASLEIAYPKAGTRMRAGKMIEEGNETNRP